MVEKKTRINLHLPIYITPTLGGWWGQGNGQIKSSHVSTPCAQTAKLAALGIPPFPCNIYVYDRIHGNRLFWLLFFVNSEELLLRPPPPVRRFRGGATYTTLTGLHFLDFHFGFPFGFHFFGFHFSDFIFGFYFRISFSDFISSVRVAYIRDKQVTARTACRFSHESTQSKCAPAYLNGDTNCGIACSACSDYAKAASASST